MIVSILNEKGGVGKTTISVNIARAMKLSNPKTRVLLVDSDSQASARDWHVEAKGELLNVIAIDRPTLDKDIQAFAHDYDWIFIDGAPALNNMAIAAIKCSDIVLIPIQPSPLDLWATVGLIHLVGDRISFTSGKLKAAFIVSRQIPKTIIGKELRSVLNEYQTSHSISTFQSGTYQRVVYATSFANGQTVLDVRDNDASKEIMSITDELRALNEISKEG